MPRTPQFIRTVLHLSLTGMLIAFSLGGAWSQTAVAVHARGQGADRLSDYKFKKEATDSLSAVRLVNGLVAAMHGDGRLAASVDSIYVDGDSLVTILHIGDQYRWARLRRGNMSEDLLNHIGYRERFYRDRPFRISAVSRLEGRAITHLEENGYPFATIRLDSLSVDDNTIEAAIDLDTGPLIIFDTLIIQGESNIKNRFMASYLGLQQGQPYDDRKVRRISRRIRQLPYVSEQRPPVVVYQYEKAKVNLFLKNKKANQVDGIIGALPNEEEDGKLLITGQVDLALRNPFGGGRSLDLHWKKVERFSQQLDAAYSQPRLFGSPIDVGLNFGLLKEDTTFLNLSRGIKVSYDLISLGKFSVLSQLRSSRLLSTSQYENATVLPPTIDYRFSSFGLGYDWNNLDDYFYPHKGMGLSLLALVGNRIIEKNSAFEDQLYANLDLKSVQYTLEGSLARYSRLGRSSVLLTRAKGGYLINDNLFLNDLFRVGGLASLRGFNENFFYAGKYAVLTGEYLFYFEETSFLLLFIDQGYVSYNIENATFEDVPIGAGGGLSFTTGPGVFTFIYALGKSKEQRFSLNQSKIHFGFISRF